METMISLPEARQLICQHTTPVESELVSLSGAHGRWLREEIRSPEDFPAFDRSSMDGYAVIGDDSSSQFTVIGEVQPGSAPAVQLERGQCVRIFTGAAIPAGASQVIMQEDVRREGDLMIPLQRNDRTNIRRRGEDVRVGDRLLSGNTRMGPGEVAMLAQAGVMRVAVARRPRVVHLATGHELVSPEIAPRPGQIRDSNTLLVAALLRDACADVVFHDRCGDDPAALQKTVENRPAGAWDLLLISGGASVGDYDFGARVLRQLGFEIIFSTINLKPGKPLVYAKRGGQIAFVIPGNPVSHFVTFHVAIRAAIERLEGAAPTWTLASATLSAPMAASTDKRETFWPARVRFDRDLIADPLRQQSSGDLGALAGANGLLVQATPDKHFSAGDKMPCLVIAL